MVKQLERGRSCLHSLKIHPLTSRFIGILTIARIYVQIKTDLSEVL